MQSIKKQLDFLQQIIEHPGPLSGCKECKGTGKKVMGEYHLNCRCWQYQQLQAKEDLKQFKAEIVNIALEIIKDDYSKNGQKA